MSFKTKDLALYHYRNKGYYFDNSMSIREDKWYMLKKGKSYVVITPKYDNILGTSWIARSFV